MEKVDEKKNDRAHMAEAISSLPVNLHVDLYDAVKSIDFDMAMKMINRVREYDQVLASGLKELLDAYRFDTLQNLFKESEQQRDNNTN